MTPMRVTATLHGAMMLPRLGIMLDSLLTHRVATVKGLDPVQWVDKLADIPIPIATSECGRVALCSNSLFEVETREKSFQNRRFPMAEAQSMGALTLKRILVGGGLSKSWRTPREVVHVESDQVVWFAIGDQAKVAALLATVSGLGPRRGVGLGRVASWKVEDAEPWPGFPVMLGGKPLRRLPLDWPGLGEHRVEYGVLAPPYWQRHREEACAV